MQRHFLACFLFIYLIKILEVIFLDLYCKQKDGLRNILIIAANIFKLLFLKFRFKN